MPTQGIYSRIVVEEGKYDGEGYLCAGFVAGDVYTRRSGHPRLRILLRLALRRGNKGPLKYAKVFVVIIVIRKRAGLTFPVIRDVRIRVGAGVRRRGVRNGLPARRTTATSAGSLPGAWRYWA